MPNWKKLLVSGSDATLNSLFSSTYVSASSFSGNFTGSLQGTSSWAVSSSNSLTASYVNPLRQDVQITGSIKITGSILGVDTIFYNTASNQPIVEGLMQWNDSEGTIDFGLKNGYITAQLAQDSFTRVYNAESNTLNVGEVVYISGSQSNRASVKRASATFELGSATVLGVVAEPITAGDFGFVMTQGVLEKLNTTGLTPGNRLYLSTSPGVYTETEPTAPNHTVVIGFVQSVDASQGRIYVKIDNGYAIGELHNVKDTSNGNSYGDLLMKSGSVWVNTKVLSGSYYVSGSITGSLFGTSSWAVTASHAVTSSYGLNPTISGSLNNVGAIYFRTSSVPPLTTAALEWDNGEGTLQLGLAGGNVGLNVGEQLYQYVYNAQGTTLNTGQVVYGSGSQGGRIAVKLASATAELGSANTIGLVAESILAGSEGWIITEGTLKNVDTSQFTSSPFAYLSASAGQFGPNYPEAPAHGVRLGIVQKVDASTGAIYVKIDNGYELEELHDVVDTTTTSSYGDFLVKSGSVWTNSKQLTGSYGLTGSLQANSFTGSLFGTSSYSLTASYVENARTASYFITSSVTSASYSATASYVSNALTASYFLTSSVTSASFALTASYVVTALTASYFVTSSVTSASYAATASYFITSSVTSASFASTASYVVTALTASYFVTSSVTSASYAATASYFVTSSVTSASFATTSSYSISSSFVTGSIYAAGNLSLSSSYAITASHAISAPLYLPLTGGTITGDLNIIGTASISYLSASTFYITASQLNIGTNIITVNTMTGSALRFGGLAVIDSGSVPQQSGSLLYDSVQDEWIFVHRGSGTTAITSSHIMMGPETYGTLGDEAYIPTNYLIKSVGNEHMTSASIVDNGSSIRMLYGTEVTGSLNVSAGVTASLFGTASYVTGSIYTVGNLALSASYAITASYSISSSYSVSSSAAITASYAVTAASASSGFTLGIGQFFTTSSITAAGTTTVSALATASYSSSFYNYMIVSASNARAGQIVSVWNGTTIRYTEVTTTDIGATATASFAVALSGNNVNLNFTAPGVWTVRTITNML